MGKGIASIIGLITLFLIVFSTYNTIAANEPLSLEIRPCYLNVCLAGDSLKLEICLNGKEEKSINVTVQSSALEGASAWEEAHTIEVNYTECSSPDLPLRADLGDENYTVTVTSPVPQSSSRWLSIQRGLKKIFKNIEETKNYKASGTFRPQFPEVYLNYTVNCVGKEMRFDNLEMRLRTDIEIKDDYDCKYDIRTRRLANIKQEFVRSYDEPILHKVSESDDDAMWETDYAKVDRVTKKHALLDVIVTPDAAQDFTNVTITPVCKVNDNEVIVYPAAENVQCPKKEEKKKGFLSKLI